MIKNGLLLTGAAARISQEVAILDLLISEGLEINQDETLLIGYSSGALNVLAINGCFRDQAPLDWNEYYKNEVLFSLKEKNVFELFPLTGKSLLNTAPFREYLSGIIDKMNFSTYGELPFKSFVLTAQYHDKKTFWVDTKNPGDANLSPLDLFMATTAIPVALPSQEIGNAVENPHRNIPDGHFVDGGSWGTFTNYNTQLLDFIKENGALEELHILSPMRETEEHFDGTKRTLLDELHPLIHLAEMHHLEFAENFNVGFGAFMNFVKGLNDLNANNQIAKKIFVSIPAMHINTGYFSFGKQESTYHKVQNWFNGDGKDQLKMPIADFIAKVDQG